MLMTFKNFISFSLLSTFVFASTSVASSLKDFKKIIPEGHYRLVKGPSHMCPGENEVIAWSEDEDGPRLQLSANTSLFLVGYTQKGWVKSKDPIADCLEKQKVALKKNEVQVKYVQKCPSLNIDVVSTKMVKRVSGKNTKLVFTSTSKGKVQGKAKNSKTECHLLKTK